MSRVWSRFGFVGRQSFSRGKKRVAAAWVVIYGCRANQDGKLSFLDPTPPPACVSLKLPRSADVESFDPTSISACKSPHSSQPTMPTRTTHRGIPVPRDQPSGSGRGDQQQAPWRSSLDLVWSYSRSQAFYGNNIATSPSFIERRWAGQDLEEGSSIYEDDEEYLSDEDEDSASVSHSRSEADTDGESVSSDSRFGPGELDWDGEAVPPNAVTRQRRRSKARDRRLEQLEGRNADEGSRSRSTSPKRLSRPGDGIYREASKLNPNVSFSDQKQSQRSSLSDSSNPGPAALRNPYADDQPASEVTPLLTTGSDLPQRKRASVYGSTRRVSETRPDSGYRAYQTGTSTLLQSWFNTVNALVGVGILALPLAFSYAGWIGGVVLFLICGLLTNYTGKVLAKIMAKEPSLRTYADIGSYAFGPSARVMISLFFCLELWAVSVALIILFSDSMAAIFPSIPAAAFKTIGYAIVLPTVFLPLKFLSPISVVGIISTFTLVIVVLSDGLIKKEAPGSLWSPAPTALTPRWSKLPLSFGLIMSGFSSHPIIPSLVRDMKDPAQFPRMLNFAYLAATIMYLSMGIIGYAMFGRSVSDEITRDLAKTSGYPVTLNKFAIWLIVINPLSKFALATRPIQTTFEILLGVDAQAAERVTFRKRTRSASSRPVSKAMSVKSGNLQPEEAPNADMQQKGTTRQTSPGHRVSFANPARPGSAEATPPPSNEHLAVADVADNPLAGSGISMRAAEMTAKLSPRTRLYCQIALKVVLTGLIVLTAILLPGFEKVMAFLGAFLAFATCVFGPLIANLKLFGAEMKRWRIGVDVTILAISAVMAGTGTVWTFLPA